MSIPQSFIQELLARTDVVEIVGRYVQLKKGGANYMGLCPFHGEKSPSFSVSPTKQFYHCFGCGKNGNAISFLMEHAGMNFVEAVKDLAGQYGMQVPEEDASPQDRARAVQQREKQATLTDVLEKAGEAYRKHLKSSPKAIDYLKGRGLSGEIARQFGLGYAPEGWRSLASVFPDYDDPLLSESGLVIVSEDEDKRYDRFRDRVMFPIRNVKGECIGFGGRVLGEGAPKYLNSPETPVFSKGRELYGLFEARHALREQGYVLVTEGYMDVVALAQLGFPNAVATLGTACTNEHVQKLFRFTDSVIFSFDGDEAGRRAARKALDGALPYATDVRSVKFLFLPAEHDPDSYIREFGRDGFARYVSEATPLSRFLIEAAREGCDLGSAEGRAHLAANARPLWSQLPEGALRRQLLGEIASHVQVEARELAALWSMPAPGRQGAAPRQRSGWEPRRGVLGTPSIAARRLGIRPSIEASASNIARLLLCNSVLWELLSAGDHEILCALDGDFGELFRWIDHQMHEHGPQPLAALAVGLEGMSFESAARRVISLDSLQPSGRMVEDPLMPVADLHSAVLKLQLDVLDLELKRVQALPSSDPTRVAQEEQLIRRQFALKQRQNLEKSR
ncbi:MAG: DNA primase [Ramlibacter sp.]